MNPDLKQEARRLGRTPAEKLAAKIGAFARERGARRRGGPIPSKGARLTPEDAVAMSDAEIIAVLDLPAINTAVRHNRYRDLLAPDCANLLVAAARKVGLAPIARPRPTVFDLEQALQSHSDADKLGEALAFIKSIASIKPDCPIAVAFSPAICQPLPDLLARRGNPVSREAVTELCRLAETIDAQAGLPADFASALVALMDQKGWTSRRLALIAGVNEATVRQWRNGSEPRSRQGAICKAIEEALEVPAGTLLNRMHTVAVRTDSCRVLTQEVRDELDAHSIPVRALGDDWNVIGDAEKRYRLDYLRRKTLETVPFRVSANKNFLEPLPEVSNPAFDAQFAALRAFKETKRPGYGARKPVYRDPARSHRALKHGGYWETSTGDLQYQNALRLIRTLRAELEPDQQAAFDALGIAVLTHASLLLAMVDAVARRRCERLVRADFFQSQGVQPPEHGMIFTGGDVSRLIVIAGYLNPRTGYLYANPPALNGLRGYIGEDWIAEATNDWQTTAGNERARMIEAAREIAREIQKVRDPWLPIEPLLAMDRPLVPLFHALDRMERDRPPIAGSPVAMARHDRDLALLRLWFHTKLRRGCLVRLTYRPDNKGMLRWSDDGGARLVIPQHLFKNRGSSALPANGQPVEIVIVPAEKELLRILRRWIVGEGHSRSLLCHDPANEFLFPGEGANALNPASMHRICMAFSTLYLVDLPWRPGGIPGVLPFGAHAIRDIAATHMIKLTHSLADAAEAIFDTIDTIRKHYARFTSAEKSRRSTRLIRESIAVDPEDDLDD